MTELLRLAAETALGGAEDGVRAAFVHEGQEYSAWVDAQGELHCECHGVTSTPA